MQGPNGINTGYNHLPSSLSALEDQIDQLISELEDGENQPSASALSLLCAKLKEIEATTESISQHRPALDSQLRKLSESLQINIEQYALQQDHQQLKKLIDGIVLVLQPLEQALKDKQVIHVYEAVKRSDQIAEGLFDDTVFTMSSLYDTVSQRLHNGGSNMSNGSNGSKPSGSKTLRAPGFGANGGAFSRPQPPEHRPTQLGLGDQEGPELEAAKNTSIPSAPKAPSFQINLDEIFGTDEETVETAPQNGVSHPQPEIPGVVDEEDESDRTNPHLKIEMLAPLFNNGKSTPEKPVATVLSPAQPENQPQIISEPAQSTEQRAIAITTPESIPPVAPVITPTENGMPKPLEPLPLPEGIILPSHSLKFSKDSAKPKPDPELSDSPYLRYTGKPSTPKGISMRAKAAVTAVLMGIAGISTYAIYRGVTDNSEKNAQLALSNTSTAPNQSNSASIPEQKPASADQKIDQKVEETKYESGLFRIDTSYPGYQDYLKRYKQAAGLVQIIKDISLETKISYEQNPETVKSLLGEGKLVLTGNESEMDQRLTAMDGFLQTAASKNLDSYPTVKSFFKNHQASLSRYKKTGTWDKEAIGYGSREFFDLFGKPLKQKAEPGVIGYAMDNDPRTNPALNKVKNFAPTYYKFLLQAAEDMKKETDPKKLVVMDSPEEIKKDICGRVAALGRADKHENVRNGIGYMNYAWCKENDGSALNYLNQAVKFTVPIRAENASTSLQNPVVPNQVIPNQGTFLPNIAPQPSGVNQPDNLEIPAAQPLQKSVEKPLAKPLDQTIEKPSLKQRLFRGLKSIFSSDPGDDAEQPKQPSANAQPLISRNDQTVEKFRKKYGLNRDKSKDYLLYM
ncbi:hypothetical protein IT411_03865 [Candidatus Peregrinibacteria bacterium]|nr:hypothetical protein [Candidatus Peregrinibacteria bacterium]